MDATMVKNIQLREIPDDKYWEWKREKDDNDEYDNWTDFFMEKIEDE